jgi:hypothetical protein
MPVWTMLGVLSDSPSEDFLQALSLFLHADPGRDIDDIVWMYSQIHEQKRAIDWPMRGPRSQRVGGTRQEDREWHAQEFPTRLKSDPGGSRALTDPSPR